MPDASPSTPPARSASLTPIWIALVLAVLVIVALTVNTAKYSAEMDRMNATGVYRTELEEWHPMRLFVAQVWGQFWWFLGPFVLCAFPGAAALYRMVRFDSSKQRRS